MRRLELIHLSIHNIDLERGTVMIRQGKGRKDRLIPIGERALAWIEKYRDTARPELVAGKDDGTLFLSEWGEAFAPNAMTRLVRVHVEKSGVGKKGACHMFRHTMATLMLEGGADIRFIQAMLGHAELSTTGDLHPGEHPAPQEHPHGHPPRGGWRRPAGMTRSPRRRICWRPWTERRRKRTMGDRAIRKKTAPDGLTRACREPYF